MWRAPGRKRSSRSRACPGPARCPTRRPPRPVARRRRRDRRAPDQRRVAPPGQRLSSPTSGVQRSLTRLRPGPPATDLAPAGARWEEVTSRAPVAGTRRSARSKIPSSHRDPSPGTVPGPVGVPGTQVVPASEEAVPAGASADDRDVLPLRSLLALRDVELDLLSFFQAAVAVTLDRAEVHEHVRATLDRDEAVALIAVEPLHYALRHLDLLRSGMRRAPPWRGDRTSHDCFGQPVTQPAAGVNRAAAKRAGGRATPLGRERKQPKRSPGRARAQVRSHHGATTSTPCRRPAPARPRRHICAIAVE